MTDVLSQGEGSLKEGHSGGWQPVPLLMNYQRDGGGLGTWTARSFVSLGKN